jgi:transposase-like protein
MKNSPRLARTITPAQRGQIVQRIIVEGWSSAEAAAHLGVSEGLVDAWVADFRHNGMASLRRDSRPTHAVKMMRLALSRTARVVLGNISARLRRFFPLELPQPLAVRSLDKDGPR